MTVVFALLYIFMILIGLYGTIKAPGLIVAAIAAIIMIGIFAHDALLRRMLGKVAGEPHFFQQLIVAHAGRHAIAKTRFITRNPDSAAVGYRIAQTVGLA